MAVDRVANSAAGNGIAPQISGAISRAAQSTGISFQYLVTTARIESSLNPQAQAATSSAKGLYQFIDQTWLATVKQDGAELGMGQYADAITRSASGRYEVADPAMRSEILKLRTDPAMSAMMAGALARTNASYLSASTGKVPTEGELYAAHFLGPEGAGRLINAVNSRGDANAATMFPAAAAANRPIFYNRDGSPRSVTEVYDRLTAKFDNTRLALVQEQPKVSQRAERRHAGEELHVGQDRRARRRLPAPATPEPRRSARLGGRGKRTDATTLRIVHP